MTGPIRPWAAWLVGALAVGVLAGCSGLNGAATDTAPAPTESPASLSAVEEVPLPSGRYVTDGAFEPRVVLSVPEGWSPNDYNAGRVSLLKAGDDVNNAFVTFYLVSAVYTDPCDGGLPIAPPETAEALVDLLRSQPGFEVGALSEGTIDGRPAWTWEVTPTVDVSICATDPWLYQFQYPATPASPVDGGTIAGAVQRFTVVDLGGTLLLAEVGTFEWTTEADTIEANEMVDSATFE